MRPCLLTALAFLAATPSFPALGETIDGRVIQIRLPDEDVTLFYVGARAVFTVKLAAKTASVEAPKLYIGDGEVAVELLAHSTNGIFLQGAHLKQGEQFKSGSTIKVRPGYKKATALVPGDVYVTLPGITFELPK